MKDPYGLVPPDIRARYEAQEYVDRVKSDVPAARELIKELRSAFGPEMDCVFVRADISPEKLPDNAVPGRWHVRRNNPPPLLATYIPITTPGGGYREPGASVIPELAAVDLRRPGVKEELIARTRTDAPHKAKERDLKKEQRLDVLKSDFKAAKRVRGEGGLKKRTDKKRSKV